MNEQKFPKGWTEERVQKLIAELDARSDEEWIAADEAAAADEGDQAVITVPRKLLPEIRRYSPYKSRPSRHRRWSAIGGSNAIRVHC
jgi:hypothetical protein